MGTAYLAEKASKTEKFKIDQELISEYRQSVRAYDEDRLRKELAGFTDDLDPAAVTDEYNRAKAELERISADIVSLRISLGALDNTSSALDDANSRIELLNDKKRELEFRFSVLERAYSAVDEAYLNMRRNFAPKVRDGAGKLLGQISDGKYSTVFLSDEMDISVDVLGKERGAGLLSAGTSDAVYIALRMSLAQNIFSFEIPFFMDETLSRLDDDRATRALMLVRDFVGAGNQCMLFTCHRREKEICEKMGIPYNAIEL
jgi:uncharacterized protein YhaN